MLVNLLVCDVCGSVVVADGQPGAALMQDGINCGRRFDTGKDVTTCAGTLRTLGAVHVIRPATVRRDDCGCRMVETTIGQWKTMHVIGECRAYVPKSIGD